MYTKKDLSQGCCSSIVQARVSDVNEDNKYRNAFQERLDRPRSHDFVPHSVLAVFCRVASFHRAMDNIRPGRTW